MIPYANLKASMTDAELETYLAPCDKWRMKSCGYKISNVVPISDELSTVQGTTTTTTTFNTRPYMVHYVDNKYASFPNATYLTNQVNANFTHNQPVTRDEGELNPIITILENVGETGGNTRVLRKQLQLNRLRMHKNYLAFSILGISNSFMQATLQVTNG